MTPLRGSLVFIKFNETYCVSYERKIMDEILKIIGAVSISILSLLGIGVIVCAFYLVGKAKE
jgi:hypothetical protein